MSWLVEDDDAPELYELLSWDLCGLARKKACRAKLAKSAKKTKKLDG